MTRARLLRLARACFLVLTVAGAWWGFRGRWDEIGDALAGTSPVRALAAVALTLCGLALTSVLWRHLLARLGARLPQRDAATIFFVGQLGKYIPGSVWTFAAQAQLGRRNRVPARSSVAASSLFLVLHTFSGVLLGSTLAAAGVVGTDLPRWLWGLAALGSAALLAPPLVRRIGSRIAGPEADAAFDVRDLLVGLGLMAAVWLAYGAAAQTLIGPAGSADGRDLVVTTAAFALSHAAGVLLVVAPAGLGAREAVLVALLGPVTGVATAAAVALLARLVHTVADFAAAGTSSLAARRRFPEPQAETAPC